MPYIVNHTNGEPLTTVADQVVNNAASISFVGKNYAGYAKLIADNFLHLMENFANDVAPSNPVQGQLWYDTSTTIQLLKIYDGTNWNPAGSIKKSQSAPEIGISINGDLWVNPDTKQLFMFTGSTWDLIGPQFSSGLKTGPLVEIFTDSLNVEHSVLSIYSQDERIAVISSAAFIPKVYTIGFEIINRGVNLSTVNLSSDYVSQPELFTSLWGTAQNANNLVINGKEINASKFLRSDISSETQGSFSVRSNYGLSIGNDLGFKISLNDSPGLVSLTAKSSKNISVNFIDNNDLLTTGLYIDSQLKVGIGNSSPTETLDVAGNTLIRNDLMVGNDNSNTVGNITTNGNLTVGSASSFAGEATFQKTILLRNTDGEPVLKPYYTSDQLGRPLYDIGTEELPFRHIYAETFHGGFAGDFTGTVHGSVYGSAQSLQTPTYFSLNGDITCNPIPFNGTADVVFQTTVSPNFISSKTAATTSLDSDLFLTYRPKTGVQKTSKSLFLASVPAVPPGAIFPYAGIELPNGYLLCDGSEVLISAYPTLFDLIKYTYRNKSMLVGDGTFALPDLRGRFALGRDDMDNNLQVPTSNGLTVSAGGNRNGSNVSGVEPANRVHHVSATTLGSGSGNESLGSPAVNGVTGISAAVNTGGQVSSIMNPYQTINYIIFTGVLL